MKITRTNKVLISLIIGAYMLMNLAISSDLISVLCFMALQALTALVALSPIAEIILRLMCGCRRIATQKEKQKLMPLYEEVYQSYKEQYPNAIKGIELFIDDSMDINAYATGRKTIVITKGAVQLLNDGQIKGLLAHEFGHHANGDTLIFPLLMVGNIFMGIVLLFIKMFEIIMSVANYMMGSQSHHRILASVISFMFHGAYTLIIFLITSLVLVNQRGSEYLADEYAMKLGYGEELKDALYLISQFEVGGKKMSLIEKVKASHPDTHRRIARLEQGLSFIAV